ncbi:MAG: hypothetical protein ABII26_13005 [Pseudomonadota bacterium]
MIFMALYNPDKFRDLIFKSKFFDLLEVEQNLKGKLASDDVALMTFALEWLKFSLFGERTIQLSTQKINLPI